MRTLVIFSALLSCICSAVCAVPLFLTVDEAGRPLPGVQVAMNWSVWKDGHIVDVAHKTFTSDGAGRIIPDSSFSRDACLEWVGKDGYVIEPDLNLDLKGPYFNYTRERPFRFVLRRRSAEQAVTVSNSGGRYERQVVARGERGTPLPLWIVGHSDAECFALPSFDEVSKEWKCAFWTTNALGGVIATTNRVYMAPEGGYQQRIEVPLKTCCSPTFTLYVKGHVPQLYAMFVICGYGTNKERNKWWESDRVADRFGPDAVPDIRKQYGVLEVRYCRFNPFGDRILEYDSELRRAIGPAYDKYLLPYLVQHRYPPRYDRPARIANAARRKQVKKEIHDLEDVLWRKRQQLEKATGRNMGWMPDEIAAQDKTLVPVCQKIRALYRELICLEKEAPTLNLPREEDGKK